MIQSLCAFPLRWAARERVTGLLYGLIVTLVWLAALGYAPNVFWLSPVSPWACCAMTVASALFLHRKLEAATQVAAQRQTESATEMAVALS